MNTRFVATLLGAVAVTALFMIWATAQLEAPTGIANTGFTQARAMETLARILGPEVPHMAGSPENIAIKGRIVAELTAAGYTPEIQATAQCAPPETRPGCTYVENIIAVKKGSTPGKAILATAHYDSVPAGPGVADDLSGTAIMLELAKTMAKRTTKNDIIFLITDGEEMGLRGALAFAQRHPLFKQVGIVVNVEARGASGPSMMFETGKGSANLMQLFARTVPNPRANSLTYEIYQLLPNDTDFSVYRKAANLNGFNFAFSNSASLYHSRSDNLANLDRNTLQHHGDNAFAIVTALAGTGLAALKSDSDASYFDVHGLVFLVWPAALNVPIAAISLIAIIGLIVVHRGVFSAMAIAWSALAIVASAVLLYAAGWMLSFPLGIWPGVHPIDHPAPWPGRIALASAGILVSLGLAYVVANRVDMRALLLASWLVLATLALAVAATVTGASYPLVWPAACVALIGWVETLTRRDALAVTGVAGFALTAFFWLAFLLLFELVLGFHLSHFKILVLLPFVLALTPVFVWAYAAREARWSIAGLAGLTVLAALIASQMPAYAPNHPRGQNISYYDDGAGAHQWFVTFEGSPDNAYLKAAGFPSEPVPLLYAGLFPEEFRSKKAANLKLEPPRFLIDQTLVQDKLKVLRGTIKGARGGTHVALAMRGKSGIQSIRIAGQELVTTWRLNQDEPLLARLTGFGARDVPIEIVFDPAKDPKLILIERAALPDAPEVQALKAARAADAAPVQTGDSAVVIRQYGLNALSLQITPRP
ncbi:MAG: M28 family peptidase [Micropepsaceae bacterium]